MYKIFCPYCGRQVEVELEKGTRKVYFCPNGHNISVTIAQGCLLQVAIKASFHLVVSAPKRKWYQKIIDYFDLNKHPGNIVLPK